MHIVQLANFHGPRSGGLKTALHELAAGYAKAGHRCTLIVPGPHDRVTAVEWGTVIEVAAPVVPGFGGYRVITDTRRVDRLLEQLAPDVVELSDKTTLVRAAGRARERGAVVVLVSHERLDAVIGHVSRLGARISSIVRCYDRQIVRQVDRIVCASRFAAREFEGGAAPPIEHIPLGVDLGTFRPRTAARRPGPLRLVSVVRLSPEKSPRLLVETSRALVERGVAHEYLVLGDGPHRHRLGAAARDLPITFAGHCADRRRLAAAMSDADIGIAPGPNETFGLAALELLASGIPVVVPAHGALPEVITAGVGVVAQASGVAFADAVISSAAALDDRVRFAARRRAEQFDWAVTVDAFLGLFERLTASKVEEGAGRQPVASVVGRSYL